MFILDDDENGIDDTDGKMSASNSFAFSDSELHRDLTRTRCNRDHSSIESPNEAIDEVSAGKNFNIHRMASSKSRSGGRNESKRITMLASVENLQEEVDQKMDFLIKIDSNKKMRSDHVHSWTLKFLQADMEKKV